MRDPERIPMFTQALSELIVTYFPQSTFPDILNGYLSDPECGCSDPFYLEVEDFYESFESYAFDTLELPPENPDLHPERISFYLRRLAKSWQELVPDWRFGQLLVNFITVYGGILSEEDEFFGELERWLDMRRPR